MTQEPWAELAEAISAIRSELERAMETGKGKKVELRKQPPSPGAANVAAVLTTPLMVALARSVYSGAPGHAPSEPRFPPSSCAAINQGYARSPDLHFPGNPGMATIHLTQGIAGLRSIR